MIKGKKGNFYITIKSTDENFDISEDQGIGTDDYNIQGEDTDENSSLDIDNAESIQDESIAASSKETDEAK